MVSWTTFLEVYLQTLKNHFAHFSDTSGFEKRISVNNFSSDNYYLTENILDDSQHNLSIHIHCCPDFQYFYRNRY